MRGLGLVMRGSVLGLLVLQGWTQKVAHTYAYHPALGTPLWTARTLRHQYSLYAPWQVLVWRWQWGSPGLRLALVGGAMGLLLLTTLGLWLAARWRSTQPPAMTGHGTTTWATRRDIRKAGLR